MHIGIPEDTQPDLGTVVLEVLEEKICQSRAGNALKQASLLCTHSTLLSCLEGKSQEHF